MVMCMFSICKVRNNSVDNETHYRREAPDTPSAWRDLGATLIVCDSVGEKKAFHLKQVISEDDALRGRDEDDALAPYSLRAWGEVRDG